MRLNLIMTGDEKLDRFLATFEPKLQKKGIRKATRAAAKVVLDDARRLAPVDSGALRKSLTVRTAKGRSGGRLPRGTFGHAVVTREGMFSGDTFYGGFLEFGTKDRYDRQGLYRGRIEAEEFLRPALYDNAPRIKSVFRSTLRQALEEIARQV